MRISRPTLTLTLAVSATALAFAAVAQAPTRPQLGEFGIDFTAMDRAVKPGDDFGGFVNGAWIARTRIAPDRTSAGAFIALADKAEQDVRTLLDAIARNPKATPAARQVADYYASWMDTAAVEKAGTAPLRPYLARIDAARTRADLIGLFGSTMYASPVSVSVGADPATPTTYSVYVRQGRLGLPARDFYLNQSEKFVAYRQAYRAYIVKIGTLAGFADPDGRADRILALETKLANDQWAPERSRDVKQTTNPMRVADLQKLAPQFDWSRYLAARGLPAVDRVIVGQTSAIAAAGQRLDDVPLATWKEYLAFRFVSDHARYLPAAFDQAYFDFYGHTLSEQPSQRERWKRGVAEVNGKLGEAVGQLYVARYYPPESDRQMGELIGDLRASYGELIDQAAWMDPATRTEAKAKLAAFDPRIGHPATYIDYAPIVVKRGDLLGNAVRADDYEWRLDLQRFPSPVDRSLWNMTPQTVNAYYSPRMNQVTFPAAILRPPFFDPAADPAVNYGAIGVVIGHEMGHGFDDQGRQSDAQGRLRDWWTPATAALYVTRADALAAQYSAYEPIPGTHINGRLTLGENLGDLGGIQAAYAAYRRYVARHGEPAMRGGLTGDQRFFIAYAQVWAAKMREGQARQQLLSDPHSPAAYRINGIVRNVDQWYEAFDVKPGDRLYLPPAQRIHVW